MQPPAHASPPAIGDRDEAQADGCTFHTPSHTLSDAGQWWKLPAAETTLHATNPPSPPNNCHSRAGLHAPMHNHTTLTQPPETSTKTPMQACDSLLAWCPSSLPCKHASAHASAHASTHPWSPPQQLQQQALQSPRTVTHGPCILQMCLSGRWCAAHLW